MSVKFTSPKPIRKLTDAMTALASGNLEAPIDGGARKDEIGDMAKAVQVFKDNAFEMTRLEREAEEQKKRAEISEISTTIASAVEEQGAAIQEISRNVQEAAGGTQEVTSNIGQVSEASQATGAAATELSGRAETLRNEVDRFLSEIRAA